MSVDAVTEVVAVDDDRPLRQGDVVRWLDAERPWRVHGLVVTADCDIAQTKHGGILSYVPILPLRDYLAQFMLPAKVRRALRPKYDEVFSQIRRWQAANRPEMPEPLSDDLIADWIASSGSSAVTEELRVVEPAQAFHSAVRVIRQAEEALQGDDFNSLAVALIAARGGGGAKRKSPDQILWAELTDAVRSLPGDAFFLNGIDRDAGGRGFVAYLRLVRESSEAEIAIRTPDLRRESVRAVRVGRLQSPYLYALTQQLGSVFSAIGLPTEYEDERGTTMDQHAQEFASEMNEGKPRA